MGSEAPGDTCEFAFEDMGFLRKGNEVFKGFNLLKEFKICIFRFM